MPIRVRSARATLALVVAAALSAGSVAACSSSGGSASGPHPGIPSGSTTAPAHNSAGFPPVRRTGFTYDVPAPLPAGSPGAVIAATAEGPDPAVHAGQRWVVLYHSTDVAGHDIAVSGQVAVPRGPAPRGGWPVVSWAHGTTGLADRCTPSETANFFDNENAQEVRRFIDAGYAVAATDYAGLGTPGVHPYLVGESEGNAVVDVVLAAHHLQPALAPTWFAVGHSQGGQAVLFATRNAAARAPQLHLGATVSMAPASALNAVLPAVILGGALDDQAYAIYALIGLHTFDPTVDPTRLLKPAGRARLPIALESGCVDQADAAFRQVPTADLFAIDAARMDELNRELDRSGDPDYLPTRGPVLLIQGLIDTDVPPGATRVLVDHLQAKGADVTLHEYPALNHDGVVGPSECDQLAWLTAHGGQPAASCAPQPTDHT